MLVLSDYVDYNFVLYKWYSKDGSPHITHQLLETWYIVQPAELLFLDYSEADNMIGYVFDITKCQNAGRSTR